MRRIICSLVAFLTLSSVSLAQRFSIMYDGNKRYYEVFVPTGYDGTVPMPLVFNLHGAGSSAASQRQSSKMDDIADTAKFIVVYPDGIRNVWNADGENSTGVDDVGFISTLIDVMAQNYSIDLRRVYSCGMSNGGYMSYTLGCQLDEKLAGIASVTGAMINDIYNTCNPASPMPVLEIHGTADWVVPYNGIPDMNPSVMTSLKKWVKINQCTGKPMIAAVPDVVKNDKSTVQEMLWGTCRNGAQVKHFKVLNGGHTWPGSSSSPIWGQIVGPTNQDINASEEIWLFFKQFVNERRRTVVTANSPVPVLEETEEVSSEEVALSLVPNPATDKVTVHVKNPHGARLIMKDGYGKVYIDQNIGSSEVTVQTSAFPKGIYVVQVLTSDGVKTGKLMVE